MATPEAPGRADWVAGWWEQAGGYSRSAGRWAAGQCVGTGSSSAGSPHGSGQRCRVLHLHEHRE